MVTATMMTRKHLEALRSSARRASTQNLTCVERMLGKDRAVALSCLQDHRLKVDCVIISQAAAPLEDSYPACNQQQRGGQQELLRRAATRALAGDSTESWWGASGSSAQLRASQKYGANPRMLSASGC